MFFSSPTSAITPALASVAMSRSDSRDSTASNQSYYTSTTTAYSALMSASPTTWSATSHPLARTDSTTSTSESTSSQTRSPRLSSSVAMRRDSSNSTWLPSPYRSCMLLQSTYGSEPNSYLSDDDLLCPPDSLPIESIPNPEPKKELTTEEQIALLRELQEKEAAQQQYRDDRRKVVRFAAYEPERKPRRQSTVKRRQPALRKGSSQLQFNGPQ